MGGEIHNFDRGGNKRRRRASWRDDRSADKYYESSEKSVIADSQTVADSTLKPGETPKPSSHKLPSRENRSADKYYRGEQKPPTKQQLQKGQKLGPPPELGAKRPQTPQQKAQAVKRASDPNAGMTVTSPGEINGVLKEVINRVQSGEQVVVYVEAGNVNLLRRTRASLEMLVTREVLTEEQFHDVRISYELSDEEKESIDSKLGAPKPREEKRVDDGDSGEVLDLAAFLAGEIEDDEEARERAILNGGTVQEVDTSADVQDSPAPSYPEAPKAEEDDDDSDFLGGQQLRNTHDELDRAVQTDAPVKITDHEADTLRPEYDLRTLKPVPEEKKHFRHRQTQSAGEVSVSQDLPTPETVTLGSDIVAEEAMDGIGDAPVKKQKPGRRSGRGAK